MFKNLYFCKIQEKLYQKYKTFREREREKKNNYIRKERLILRFNNYLKIIWKMEPKSNY